ncbi:MAG TPA: FKBP-type peptidyl-prolyl cis-trans isomerase [Ignavibacteriaceae bacterium]|nr:FKBP-type peptidyl-prolyl cis-trans isomerase [Ignavibacteriaceae bacterium]
MDSGLIYVDNKIGTGKEAEPCDVVSIHFKAWIIKDSTGIFDEESNNSDVISLGNSYPGKRPIEFILEDNNFIKGSDKGIAGMKKGGIRTMIIPAKVIYGSVNGNSYPADINIKLVAEIIRLKKNKVFHAHK